MKLDSPCSEDLLKLQSNVINRETQERLANVTVTSETLSLLNISIERLPQRCKDQLHQSATLQQAFGMEHLDPTAISVQQSKAISQHLQEEYELLELRQKNAELQRQIDRNRIFIEGLRKELQSSRELQSSQDPNPETIHEHIRETRQRLVRYEEVYANAKAKFEKLQVSNAIFPKSLEELVSRLATLKEEEESLRLRADDITLARQASETLKKLRRTTLYP